MCDMEFMVLRLKDRPGKFIVFQLNSEPHGLSPHCGELTDLEARQFLENRGVSIPQVEMLIRQAKEAPG
jgi:hypothetical protein